MGRMGLRTANANRIGLPFATAWTWLLALIVLCCDVLQAEVVVYPRPDSTIRQSDLYRVSVIQDGKTYESFLYQIHSPQTWSFGHNVCSFTTFSFCDPIVVEVTRLNGTAFSSCRVYPSSYEIAPEVVGYNKVRFTLARPLKKMVVIFDNDWMTHPLLISADPLEANVPHPPGRPENLENGIGATGGGRWYNNAAGSGGVAGRGQMGNVG